MERQEMKSSPFIMEGFSKHMLQVFLTLPLTRLVLYVCFSPSAHAPGDLFQLRTGPQSLQMCLSLVVLQLCPQPCLMSLALGWCRLPPPISPWWICSSTVGQSPGWQGITMPSALSLRSNQPSPHPDRELGTSWTVGAVKPGPRSLASTLHSGWSASPTVLTPPTHLQTPKSTKTFRDGPDFPHPICSGWLGPFFYPSSHYCPHLPKPVQDPEEQPQLSHISPLYPSLPGLHSQPETAPSPYSAFSHSCHAPFPVPCPYTGSSSPKIAYWHCGATKSLYSKSLWNKISVKYEGSPYWERRPLYGPWGHLETFMDLTGHTWSLHPHALPS